MKKHILMIAFGIACFTMLTAFTYNNAQIEPKAGDIEVVHSSTQKTWGPWKQTSCFKGLDYRVEYRGKNYNGTKHKWGVQFRNRYYDKIHFNYEVFNNRPSSPRTTNRTDLDHNETSSGNRDFYMQNGNSIYVYVDKVRFNKDGLQDYYDCDK